MTLFNTATDPFNDIRAIVLYPRCEKLTVEIGPNRQTAKPFEVNGKTLILSDDQTRQ